MEKGYEVHGLVRRHSISVTSRIDHLIHSPYNNVKFFLHYADTTDSSGLMRLMAEIKPTEVYNLAAQSHVGISFEVPEYTGGCYGNEYVEAFGGHSDQWGAVPFLSGVYL